MSTLAMLLAGAAFGFLTWEPVLAVKLFGLAILVGMLASRRGESA